MEKNLFIDASHPNETRVVLKSENNIEDYEYESLNNTLIKNNIYLGKVSRIEPSLQAAFVDFGRDRHGFLSFNDIQSDYYQLPKDDLEKIKKEEEKARELLSKESEIKEISQSDSLDENGNRNYDEIIDKDMANIINMIDGELMLPSLHPFAEGDSLKYGQNIDQLKGQLGDGTMYLSSSSSEINGDHRWMIEAEYTNQSSTINLGFSLKSLFDVKGIQCSFNEFGTEVLFSELIIFINFI